MLYYVMAIVLCLSVPSKFCYDDGFRAEVMREYEGRVLDSYVSSVREDLRYNGMCYEHSIELIKRLRKVGEHSVLMGVFHPGEHIPYHYYVYTKRWGAVDVYPEGREPGPLNGIMLDQEKYRVPGYINVPNIKPFKLPEKPREQKLLA